MIKDVHIDGEEFYTQLGNTRFRPGCGKLRSVKMFVQIWQISAQLLSTLIISFCKLLKSLNCYRPYFCKHICVDVF